MFDDDEVPETPAERTLILRARPGEPLSKKQKAFNRLLDRVETLRARFESERRRLDAALVAHAAEIAPRLQQIARLRADVVQALRPFLDDRRVLVRDRKLLRDVLVEQLDEVLSHDAKPSQEMRELFEQLHGLSLDEAARQEMDDVRSSVADMFKEMGLDVDVAGMRHDMSEEEIAAMAAEMNDQMRQQVADAESQRQNRAGRKKGGRGADRAARIEDARKSSIGTVYRRLVKTLHPDLEQDPAAREKKSALMQEVTAAHARRDLLALLRLEMEWVDSENTGAAAASDETLDAYTHVLREQAAELEGALSELPLHPRYGPLMSDAGPFAFAELTDIPAEAARLEELAEQIGASLARLRSSRALDEVKAAVRIRRETERQRRW